MALVLKDRVLETCTSPGTGSVSLLGAVTGYQTFLAAIGNTNTCYYTIADQNGANWEVGLGTYSSSGNTLARTTILSSSNGGSTVNFASGSQNVFVTYPSEKAVYQDASGAVAFGAITATSITDSGLTSGRVTYASTGGLLADSSVFTFDGTTLASPSHTLTGNLTFTGTGNRITGDFSNATVANRVAFQTSTTNGSSSITLLPNGTGLNAFYRSYGNSDPTNASEMAVGVIGTTEVRLQSGIIGTGTYLPMTFYTGGSEKVRIDTSGNVGIGTSSPGGKLAIATGGSTDVVAALGGGYPAFTYRNGSGSWFHAGKHPSSDYFYIGNGATPTTNISMVVDPSGNVGIGTSSPSGYKLNVQGGDAYFTGSLYARNNNYFGINNQSVSMQHYTAANWNYSGLNLWRNASNTATPRFLGMPLDGDSDSNTTIGGYNAIWGVYDSSPTTGSTSSALNGKMAYAAYAGHIWYTNGTERMRIDSSGNVGIGTSSPTNKLEVNQGSAAAAPSLLVTPQVYAKGYAGSSITYSGIGFAMYEHTNGYWGSGILARDDTGSYGSALAFYTSTGSPTPTPAERMRIDSSGNVLVGTTSQLTNEKFGVLQSSASAASARFYASSTSYTNDVVQISCARSGATTEYNAMTVFDNNTTLKMLIRANGNLLNANNSYGSLSDQSLKENIVDATPKLEKLNQVRVVNFNMIGDEQKQIGVIAQELEQVFPSMVEENQDGVKAVKYSVFVPMLIKAIQEQQAIITQLQADVAALKGAK